MRLLIFTKEGIYGLYSAERFFWNQLPIFIDFSITIFTLLPIFMAGAIFLARREFIKHHIIIQISLFVLVSSTLLIDIYSFSQVDIELKNGIIFYSYHNIIFSYITRLGN